MSKKRRQDKQDHRHTGHQAVARCFAREFAATGELPTPPPEFKRLGDAVRALAVQTEAGRICPLCVQACLMTLIGDLVYLFPTGRASIEHAPDLASHLRMGGEHGIAAMLEQVSSLVAGVQQQADADATRH